MATSLTPRPCAKFPLSCRPLPESNSYGRELNLGKRDAMATSARQACAAGACRSRPFRRRSAAPWRGRAHPGGRPRRYQAWLPAPSGRRSGLAQPAGLPRSSTRPAIRPRRKDVLGDAAVFPDGSSRPEAAVRGGRGLRPLESGRNPGVTRGGY
jgi:hypothetical protein